LDAVQLDQAFQSIHVSQTHDFLRFLGILARFNHKNTKQWITFVS
jgi:hypothetical protein